MASMAFYYQYRQRGFKRSLSSTATTLERLASLSSAARRDMSLDFADFVKVAELGEIEEGEMMAVEVDGEPICLANVDGTICAFTDNCTHIGGPLNEGELD